MKHILLILVLIAGTFNMAAQYDKPMSGMAIPSTKNPEVSPPAPAPEAPRIFTVTPKKSNSTLQVGGENSSFSMTEKKEEFVNRSSEYKDRVNVRPRGESNEAFRGNMDFGVIKINSEFIEVMARDFGAEDGDRIKVLVNDRVVISEIMLTNNYRGLQIKLEPGFNKIDFEALNQGYSGPNTAEFKVYDDKKGLISSNEWNLATGFKATVIFVKE